MAICQPQNENSDNKSDAIGKNIDLNNIKNQSHGELSQLIQNFDRMNTKEIVESLTQTSGQNTDKNSLSEKNLGLVVSEIVNFIFKMIKKGTDKRFKKQDTLDYFNNYDISSKKIY